MFIHKTVLLQEALTGLNIFNDGVYIDCTLGGAGHTEQIISFLSAKGALYSFDQDEVAISHARKKIGETHTNVHLVHSNFANIKKELAKFGVGKVDGILYDLGVSSPQFDTAERGFSYNEDALLDMRMDRNNPLSAYQIVNEWSYSELVSIFFRYGEEKFAKSIARRIEESRKQKPIESTKELVDIIKQGIPERARRTGGHPARRVFQAIRIAVNDEIEALEVSLEQAVSLLRTGGRLVTITFHSLEDRVCKHIFNKYAKAQTNELVCGLPLIRGEAPVLKKITRKPLMPSNKEILDNPRARSAKMRVVEKI